MAALYEFQIDCNIKYQPSAHLKFSKSVVLIFNLRKMWLNFEFWKEGLKLILPHGTGTYLENPFLPNLVVFKDI